MKRLILITSLILTASAAPAQQAVFQDDRSTPAAVVESLYNAINRHEYLRAYSYFASDRIGDYEMFKAGYADTDHVDLHLAPPQTEGAAGTTYTMLPVVIRATRTDGTQSIFAGCYAVSQVSPSIQDQPPYIPIRIIKGTLAATDANFDDATGHCAPY